MTEALTTPTTTARLPAALRSAVDDAIERAVSDGWAQRIWDRDTTVWTRDPSVAALIADRLGWLDAPASFRERVGELRSFASAVRDEGLTRAIVAGMGGSSLAPEVLLRSMERGPAGIDVGVLDSTDPAAIAPLLRDVADHRTLYLIASKSGTTTETLSFLAAFWDAEAAAHSGGAADAAHHFVAISDPGRSVAAIPNSDTFRASFLNPPDVGGRYSALTYVGLVPAALLDVDLGSLLDGAAAMADRCRDAGADNPGVALGVAMATLARQGRDKLTFVTEPGIASFGAWAEQLIAESTGKHGVGVVPIDLEPPGEPSTYGEDRVFVRLATGSDAEWAARTDPWLERLERIGHPVIDIPVGREGLGGEFFRWEFATAVAGAVLGINPFDEPNVTESKDNTRRVLDEYRSSGVLPEDEIIARDGPLSISGDAMLRLSDRSGDLDRQLARHLERARPAGYLAFQAYVRATPERDAALGELRRIVRDRTRRATTAGYGPRFLHSTGQLHKGGPPTGCFIQLVAGHPEDVPVPGTGETFATLIDAQALGDFASLEGHDLPVLRVHLSDDPDAGLAALRSALERAL